MVGQFGHFVKIAVFNWRLPANHVNNLHSLICHLDHAVFSTFNMHFQSFF